MGLLLGGLAMMGNVVFYVLVVKFCYLVCLVVVLVGDGVMQMLGLNGLVIIVEWWLQWFDLRLIVMVLYNGDLNMVIWEQCVMVGDFKFSDLQNLFIFLFVEFVCLLGLYGLCVDCFDQIVGVWVQVLVVDWLVLVEVMIDFNVLLLFFYVGLWQVGYFVKVLLYGDFDVWQVVMVMLCEVWDGLVIGKG